MMSLIIQINLIMTSQGICPTFIMLAVSRGMASSSGDYGASCQWQPSKGTSTAPQTSHIAQIQFAVTTTAVTVEMETQESTDTSSEIENFDKRSEEYYFHPEVPDKKSARVASVAIRFVRPYGM